MTFDCKLILKKGGRKHIKMCQNALQIASKSTPNCTKNAVEFVSEMYAKWCRNCVQKLCANCVAKTAFFVSKKGVAK